MQWLNKQIPPVAWAHHNPPRATSLAFSLILREMDVCWLWEIVIWVNGGSGGPKCEVQGRGMGNHPFLFQSTPKCKVIDYIKSPGTWILAFSVADTYIGEKMWGGHGISCSSPNNSSITAGQYIGWDSQPRGIQDYYHTRLVSSTFIYTYIPMFYWYMGGWIPVS